MRNGKWRNREMRNGEMGNGETKLKKKNRNGREKMLVTLEMFFWS